MIKNRFSISDSSFTATAVIQKKSKTNIPAKKSKITRSKKPQETLNKENKEIKSEKPTNYLRKILTNELKFSETENPKEKDSEKDQEQVDVKVLGEHSYFEATKDSEAAENLASNVSSEIITNSEENVSIEKSSFLLFNFENIFFKLQLCFALILEIISTLVTLIHFILDFI